MKPKPLICSTLVIACCANWAFADDQALLVTTRELAKESLKDYDEGRYDQAAEKSLRAYQVMRVPTLAVNRARALAKLGRLIAATELYLEATRLERADSWQPIQDEAQAAAERERIELLPRIARLRVAVENADSALVSIAIDETLIPNALLDSEHRIDPGVHTVVGTYGRETLRQTVRADEGARIQTLFRFQSSVDSKAHPPAPRATRVTASPVDSVGPGKPDVTRRVIGWSALGLGGVGIAVGVVEGLAASAKREQILNTNLCALDRQHCDPSLSGEIDSYRTMRTISTLGFAAGSCLTLAGVTMLLWLSDSDSPRQVGLAVGPNYLGVQGDFR